MRPILSRSNGYRVLGLFSAGLLVLPVCLVVFSMTDFTRGSKLPPSLIFFGLATIAQFSRLASGPLAPFVHSFLSGERPHLTDGIREDLPRLVSAAVIERCFVAVATLVATTVVVILALGILTVDGYLAAANGVRPDQRAEELSILAVLTALAIGSIIGAPTRLGITLSHRLGSRLSPLSGFTIARRRPRLAGVLILCRSSVWLFVVGDAARFFITGEPATSSIDSLLPVYILSIVGATVVESRLVLPKDDAFSVPIEQPIQVSFTVVVTFLVILAAITVPTVGVRIDDTKPQIGSSHSVDGDQPSEKIVETVSRNWTTVDQYRVGRRWQYDRESGEWERLATYVSGYDFSDRQVLMAYAIGRDSLDRHILSDGAYISDSDISGLGPIYDFKLYSGGGWYVRPSPSADYRHLLNPTKLSGKFADRPSTHNWTLMSESDETLVLGIEDRDELVNVFGAVETPKNISNDSYVYMVVDKRNGRVTKIRTYQNLTVRGERQKIQTVIRFEHWRTYDLKRPEPVRGQSPLELFWDVFGY